MLKYILMCKKKKKKIVKKHNFFDTVLSDPN